MTYAPEDEDRAKAFLEAHVPGYTVGQWAALAELLASQRARERESTPTSLVTLEEHP